MTANTDPHRRTIAPEDDPLYSREVMLDLLRRENLFFNPKAKSRPPLRPVVYYLRWADRVKIGYSTRLSERLRSVYHDEVMAAEPGSIALERQRHNQFKEYLIAGQREWFYMSPALLFHINTVKGSYGTNGVKR